MSLKSGTIIPFQFKDIKKLIMIGLPADCRDLSIWDLKNVVQASFGIVNCEFRNKKIGFTIPDNLLLDYLGQRRDLTNFVIEIEQTNVSGGHLNDAMVFIPKPIDSTGNCDLQQRKMSNGSNIEDENMEISQQQRVKRTPEVPLLKPKIEQIPDENVNSLEVPKMPQSGTLYINPKPIFENAKAQFMPTVITDIAGSLTANGGEASKRQKRTRRQKQKTTFPQKEVYLSYLESNSIIGDTKPWSERIMPLWDNLAAELNNVFGPVKSTMEWISTFDNWRYSTFSKVRYNASITGPAALQPKNFKPISNQEERAYMLWTANSSWTPNEFRDSSALNPDSSLGGNQFERCSVDEKLQPDVKNEIFIDSSSNDFDDSSLLELQHYSQYSTTEDSEQRITNSPIFFTEQEKCYNIKGSNAKRKRVTAFNV